jgi:excisionase family DNA binding protein
VEAIEFLPVACDRCGRTVARDPRTWSDSVPEVAAQIGLSPRATYRLIESGHLRSYKAGRARRILHADVVAFVARQRDCG